MPSDFHARFKAIARRYRYITLNQTHRPALLKNLVTHVHEPLDVSAMQAMTEQLVGTHDFQLSSVALPISPAYPPCASRQIV